MATLFQPHDRIAGRFQIISYVGSGGIGEVYRASDETGFIAIKALLPRVVPAYITTDRIRDALLGHLPEEDPMVLPREVVEHGEVRCIVSRFVAGEDARELLRRRDRSADPRPALMFFDLFLERLSSLPPFAVHGALKPENIIVAQAGDRLFHRDVEIQITDINFPRVLSFSKYASIQLARGPAFDYLAPEFVTMGGRVDQRADIYSAGMLLYELLTGTTAKKEFAPPSKAGSAAPRELDDVLRRALAASPDERFSSLREFQDALRKAAPVIGERLASQPIEMSQIDMFTGREEVTHRVDVSTIEEFDPFSEAPAEPRAAAAAHRGPGEFEDIDRAFDQAMETGEAQEFTAPEDVTHEDMEPVFDDVDVFAEPAEKPRETIHAEPPFVLPAAPLAPRPEAATDMASRVVFAFLGIAAVIVGFFIYRSVTAPDDAVTPVAIATPVPTPPPAPPAPVDDAQTSVASIEEATPAPTQAPFAPMTPTPEAPAGPDPRQAMIQALVLEAQSFLISKQYVRPARPDNVLDKLKKIEEIEPKHPFLAAARGQILDDYEGQIDKAIARKDWLAARNLVNDARLVAPDHPRVGNLDARVEDAGKSAAAPAVAATGECPADMAFISGGTFSMGIRPNDPMAQPNDPAPSEAAFKSFCVDFFEYPNKEGALPEGGFDFAMAQNACKDAGKRLCTETEWEAACASGTRDRKFPYGNVYIEDACATQTSEGRDRGVAYSGSWHGCKTVQNVFDLSGNLREWTATPFDDDKTAYVIKGGDGYNPGHAARCGARQSAAGSAKRSWLGFRCCKDPS